MCTLTLRYHQDDAPNPGFICEHQQSPTHFSPHVITYLPRSCSNIKCTPSLDKTRTCRWILLFIALALANISLKVSARYEVVKNSLALTTVVAWTKTRTLALLRDYSVIHSSIATLYFRFLMWTPWIKHDLAAHRDRSCTCAVNPHPFDQGTSETLLILVPLSIMENVGICTTLRSHDPI